MPLPLDTAEQIASRAAGLYETAFPPVPGVSGGIDARSPGTVAGVNTRIVGMAGFALRLYLEEQASELMPDTAVTNLSRHAAIWGVTRDQPTPGTGNLTVTASSAAFIPINASLSAPSGTVVTVTSATSIAAGATAAVPVQTSGYGAVQNQAAGVVFRFTSPIMGLNPQSGTVDSNGITGGTDLESTDSWRLRMLAKIRQPPSGGAAYDYIAWAKAAASTIQYVSVQANYGGLGNVGVIVAAADPGSSAPRVATSGELAEVTAYLTDPVRKPVCAVINVVGATLLPVAVTLHLNPDTPSNRIAAATALALFFLQDAQIGGTIYASRLDNAVSNGSGEYSHERTLPAADVTAGATQMPSLSTVTWV